MEEDRWGKLEEIVRRVVKEELAAHGFKAKTKLLFEGGKWHGITEEQKSAWRTAYQAVDIESHLAKSAAWIVSNPNLAPKSQFARFLNTWFSREQDRSSIRAIPTRSDKPEKMTCDYCGARRSGVTNGITHCSAHTQDAMDQKAA